MVVQISYQMVLKFGAPSPLPMLAFSRSSGKLTPGERAGIKDPKLSIPDLCDLCGTRDSSRVFISASHLVATETELGNHNVTYKNIFCHNWTTVQIDPMILNCSKLVWNKKTISYFCFTVLDPLKSPKSSCILIVFVEIFRLSNIFTAKLNREANE